MWIVVLTVYATTGTGVEPVHYQGKILDPNGHPAPGAKVTLHHLPWGVDGPGYKAEAVESSVGGADGTFNSHYRPSSRAWAGMGTIASASSRTE